MKAFVWPLLAAGALLGSGLVAGNSNRVQRLLVHAPLIGLNTANATVSSTDELDAALARATGGVIKLRPGTYTPVSIQSINPGAVVTITSADPSHPAMMTGMTVRDSSNLVIDRLSFGVLEPSQQYGLNIQSSRNVGARRLAFAWPGGVQGSNAISALFVRNSQQVDVAGSSFRDHWHGVSFIDVEDLHIADNLFTDLRTDGIRGGGVQRLTIERNVIGNFHPLPGDHPDGIQLWSTNEQAPGRDIAIRDNLVWRGRGQVVQGIFIRDTQGNLPFERVTVDGNISAGTLYNGIALLGVNGATVSNNRVVGFPDMKSWIRLDQVTRVTLTGNAAALYLIDEKRSVTPPRTNLLVKPPQDRGLREISEWLKQHPSMRDHFDELQND